MPWREFWGVFVRTHRQSASALRQGYCKPLAHTCGYRQRSGGVGCPANPLKCQRKTRPSKCWMSKVSIGERLASKAVTEAIELAVSFVLRWIHAETILHTGPHRGSGQESIQTIRPRTQIPKNYRKVTRSRHRPADNQVRTKTTKLS